MFGQDDLSTGGGFRHRESVIFLDQYRAFHARRTEAELDSVTRKGIALHRKPRFLCEGNRLTGHSCDGMMDFSFQGCKQIFFQQDQGGGDGGSVTLRRHGNRALRIYPLTPCHGLIMTENTFGKFLCPDRGS